MSYNEEHSNTKHIRPKLRNKSKPPNQQNLPSYENTLYADDDIDKLLAITKCRMLKAFEIADETCKSKTTQETATLALNENNSFDGVNRKNEFQNISIKTADGRNAGFINTQCVESKNVIKPKGILKNPTHLMRKDKVEARKTEIPSDTTVSNKTSSIKNLHHPDNLSLETLTLAQELGIPDYESDMLNENNYDEKSKNVKHPISPLVKDLVVERANPRAETYPSQSGYPIPHDVENTNKIEGYTPSYDETSSQPMKIIKTVDELVDYANTLKSESAVSDASSISDDGKNISTGIKEQVIEADVEFMCMTDAEYNEANNAAESLGISLDEYLSSKKTLINNNKNVNSVSSDDEDDNEIDDDDGDNDMLEILGVDDDSDEEESEPAHPMRPFIIIWDALSTWLTPNAVSSLQKWKNDIIPNSQIVVKDDASSKDDRNDSCNDIALSRYSGLMSMLKMNLSKSLTELGYNEDDGYTRRMAESRLSEFTKSFDFSLPMVKFDSQMWRILTIVLLDIVLPKYDLAYEGKGGIVTKDDVDNTITVPHSISEAGITFEEYRYLTQSTIASLHQGIAA